MICVKINDYVKIVSYYKACPGDWDCVEFGELIWGQCSNLEVSAMGETNTAHNPNSDTWNTGYHEEVTPWVVCTRIRTLMSQAHGLQV